MFLFPCGWWTCTIILFDYFNWSLINSFCMNWFSLLLLINSFSIILLSLLITNCVTCLSTYVLYGLRVWNKDVLLLLLLLLVNSFWIIWSSLLFDTLYLSLFLFIRSYLLSHISFWMADENAIWVIPHQITQGPTWLRSDVSEKILKNTSMCSNDTNKIVDADHYSFLSYMHS